MTHITCRLTTKNRDQLRNPTLGDRVWATFLYKGGGGGVPKHTEYRCSLLLQMEWSDPSACVVGTSMSHAKMAEGIEMPFGADSHGPRSHV